LPEVRLDDVASSMPRRAATILRNPGRGAPPPRKAPPGDPRAFHRRLPGYAPTPLVDAPALAADLGLARLWVKDESSRLGLPAFKILGASWATYRLLVTRLGDEPAWSGREDLRAALARLGALTHVAATSFQHQVVSAAVEKQAVLQKLSEFDALRLQAAALLAESQRRLATVDSELARVPSHRTATVKTDAGVARDITARIMSLEMQRTQLLQKFTPSYQGVVQIDGQLREARAALEAARQAPVVEETVADNPTRQWLDTEVSRTRAEQAALQARVAALNDAVNHYRQTAMTLELRDSEQKDLEREMKAAETKYLLYAQKQEEARISDELDRTRIANVVVAEGPSVAVEAQRDPSLAFLPLLLGAALLLSGGLAIAVDAVSPAYRSWKSERRPAVPVLVHPAPSEQPVS
jgi:hypothetical protein